MILVYLPKVKVFFGLPELHIKASAGSNLKYLSVVEVLYKSNLSFAIKQYHISDGLSILDSAEPAKNFRAVVHLPETDANSIVNVLPNSLKLILLDFAILIVLDSCFFVTVANKAHELGLRKQVKTSNYEIHLESDVRIVLIGQFYVD